MFLDFFLPLESGRAMLSGTKFGSIQQDRHAVGIVRGFD
jgi:hypothetical protein